MFAVFIYHIGFYVKFLNSLYVAKKITLCKEDDCVEIYYISQNNVNTNVTLGNMSRLY